MRDRRIADENAIGNSSSITLVQPKSLGVSSWTWCWWAEASVICGSVWSSGQIFGTFPVAEDIVKLRALPEKTADEDPCEIIGPSAERLMERR